MAETRFHSMLKALILEVINSRMEEISRGVLVENYREQVGYCNGLRDALKYCEQVEQDFDK